MRLHDVYIGLSIAKDPIRLIARFEMLSIHSMVNIGLDLSDALRMTKLVASSEYLSVFQCLNGLFAVKSIQNSRCKSILYILMTRDPIKLNAHVMYSWG